jgi:hypothetical protein
MKTLQTKRVILSKEKPGALRLKVVVIRLREPKMEEKPATWRLRMDKSTAGPAENGVSERGGYKVQPVPAPPEKSPEVRSVKETGRSLKEMLLRRGKALSRAPRCMGKK